MSLLSSVKELLFGKKSGASITIFPEIKKFPPMPSVKSPAPPASEIRVDHSLEVEEKPKLTEPVEVLLKAMRERTETFCITLGHNLYNDLYKHSWDILDTKTNFKFTLKLRNISRDLFYSTESWMTEEDCSAIVDLIRKKNDGIHLGDKEERRLEIVALYKENT